MNFYPNIIYWPRLLNRDRMWTWELAARTISGGRAMSGLSQSTRSDGGGLWSAMLGDVQVSTEDQVRTWRAIAARLDSGSTPIVLEVRDVRFSPWPLSGGVPITDQYEATNSDDSTCSDDTSYVSDVISASLVSAAALRATELTIAFLANSSSALRGGEYFSIQHDTFSHRLYRVGKVTLDGSGNSVVTIRPPLREATTAGTRVEFDYPKCVMKLATPDAMDLALEMRFHGKASVKFVEDFPPFDLVEADMSED